MGHGLHPLSGMKALPKHLNSRKLEFATDPVWIQTLDNQQTKVLNYSPLSIAVSFKH
jgi:hypothetical protein